MNSLSNVVMNMTASEVAEEKIGEVGEELQLLINAREMLQKQHEVLEHRLRGILAQRAEATGNAQSTPERVRVPLAQALHNEVTVLMDLSSKVQSTINRIEL